MKVWIDSFGYVCWNETGKLWPLKGAGLMAEGELFCGCVWLFKIDEDEDLQGYRTWMVLK